jgi:ATP-dependent RNA helicase DeaD
MTDNTIPVQTAPVPPVEFGPADTLSEPAAALGETPPDDTVNGGFDDLGLHPDVRQALDDMGYFQPTPVQRAVYEPVTMGKDLLVQSRTGTGKTTAFGLPIVNRIVPAVRKPQAMVLCPTRELALQVARELTQIGKLRGVIVEAVYGGAPIAKQIAALNNGVHVVVGTPGRVLDHIGRRTLDCSAIGAFILDECDEMLSMGFLEDIERVTGHLPEKHQTLLFSATMPDEVARYARRHMTAAETLSLSRDSISVADIHHAYYIVSGIARSRDLLKVIYAEQPESAIIFCNLRDETTTVAKFLNKQGLDAEPLSSDLSQADRERVMSRMKEKNLRFLCATDVAARGIDISNLSHVINFSVPEQPEVYVHRTGRTGRAGKKGTALSLVGPRELGNFRYIRLQFGIKPEERLLPKDEIFVGRLKVPLPPVGAPQPPDPVQILIRGVPQTPSDLERQIFEKLLASASGKRVLAQLVAEKLNALSTRTTPRSRGDTDRTEKNSSRNTEIDRGAAVDKSQLHDVTQRITRTSLDRFDRDSTQRITRDQGPNFGDRSSELRDRSRPRGPERDAGERTEPRLHHSGRGDRSESDRSREGEFFRDSSGRERPRFDRDSGNGRGRSDRRPEGGSLGGRGFEGDAENGRTDRESRGERRGRDRMDRPRSEQLVSDSNRNRSGDAPQMETPTSAGIELGSQVSAEGTIDKESTGNGRHARGDTIVEAISMGGALIEGRDTLVPPGLVRNEVPRDTIQPDRAPKRSREKPTSEPSEATREFWETWAETKTATVPPPVSNKEGTEPAEVLETEPRSARTVRSGRSRNNSQKTGDSGKSTTRDSKRSAKKAEPAPPVSATPEATRTKHDTQVVSSDAQARLFVNLGKKHGVTPDDLRTLLARPLGGDRARIGSVSLRDSHAHVRVPEDVADAIISSINGTQHNEHAVTVERSRS